MPGIFDIIGPVMVGPSSSHTAGAVRLGLFARRLHGAGPARVEIGLHGSFAATGDGHGTPLALLAGVMGLAPDDGRIPQAKELASQHGLSYAFSAVDLGEVHPNSVRIRLSSATGLPDERTEICGSSTGGGEIQIWRIDDFRVDLHGEYPTLLMSYPDHPGAVAAVSSVLAQHGLNIAGMKVHRTARGGLALMTIELDQEPDAATIQSLHGLEDITSVRYVPEL